MEVRENHQRVVGTLILKDVDPTADGARLEVVAVFLEDSPTLAGQLGRVGLGCDHLALGVLLSTRARRTIEKRLSLKLISSDYFSIMDVDEHAIAQENVGVGKFIADFGFNAVEIGQHGGRGIEIDRQALREDTRPHDRPRDEVLAAARAHAFT